jgi:hypothetical protein
VLVIGSLAQDHSQPSLLASAGDVVGNMDGQLVCEKPPAAVEGDGSAAAGSGSGDTGGGEFEGDFDMDGDGDSAGNSKDEL